MKVKMLIEKGANFHECLTDETYIYDLLYSALSFNKIEIIRHILKK